MSCLDGGHRKGNGAKTAAKKHPRVVIRRLRLIIASDVPTSIFAVFYSWTSFLLGLGSVDFGVHQ